MGAAGGGSLRDRCVYDCVETGSNCVLREGYEAKMAEDLRRAIQEQDMEKVDGILGSAPALKEREIRVPGPNGEMDVTTMTALGLALNRHDTAMTRALLAAGISPNLPISEKQRGVYAQRSQLAAKDGGDPDLQHLVPATHFEALCSTQHKDLFMVLLEYGANPNSGLIQVCLCGDAEMVVALLDRSAETDVFQRNSTPLLSAVKSQLEPYAKCLALLRAAADPNFVGFEPTAGQEGRPRAHPPVAVAARRRDYMVVRLLLQAGADLNLEAAQEEGLPNALFWAAYWGDLELIRIFIALSKHPLDLSIRKYTGETIFDVVHNSRSFAVLRKPHHIDKLPLPKTKPAVYDKICRLLEEYQACRFPDQRCSSQAQRPPGDAAGALGASCASTSSRTGSSTTATCGVSTAASSDRPAAPGGALLAVGAA